MNAVSEFYWYLLTFYSHQYYFELEKFDHRFSGELSSECPTLHIPINGILASQDRESRCRCTTFLVEKVFETTTET